MQQLIYVRFNRDTSECLSAPQSISSVEQDEAKLPRITSVLSLETLRNHQSHRSEAAHQAGQKTSVLEPLMLSLGVPYYTGRTGYAGSLPAAPIITSNRPFPQPANPAHLAVNGFPRQQSRPSSIHPAAYHQAPPIFNFISGTANTMHPYERSRTFSASNSSAHVADPRDLDDRTPKLKYSHKIAERKRRKDMNDTFDELKATLPSGNSKMSKWEILMSASQHIRELISIKEKLAWEKEILHRELGLPPVELRAKK